MKKLLALVLVLCMVMSLAACQTNTPVDTNPPATDGASVETPTEGVEAPKGPAYLNMDSDLPFVKEGTEDITLTMWVAAQDGAKDVEKTWLWTYLTEEGNVNLEITLIPWSTKGEKLNAALATNTLPDIMYNMQLSASQLVTYGQEEHILADLSGLIADYAPNITALLDEYPVHRQAWTAPDGGIYSIGQIGTSINTGGYKMFLNEDWMEEAGITELPKTLDEFEEVLRKFKDLCDGENEVPLAGYAGADHPLAVILQALGFRINSFRNEVINSAAVVGDEVAVISTHDLYAEYLKIAHEWYEEGLISQDYYTVDWKTTRAQAGEELCGAYAQFGMDTMLSFVKDANGNLTSAEEDLSAYLANWTPLSPLTSEWNSTPQQLKSDGVTVGNWVVSEECEHKELAVRMANWFFSTEGSILAKYGPMAGGDVPTYDLLPGWSLTEEADGSIKSVMMRDIGEELSIYSGYYAVGADGDRLVMPDTGKTLISAQYEMAGLAGKEPEQYNLNDKIGRAHAEIDAAVGQYAQYGIPSVWYMDQETADTIADLGTVVSNYAFSETAKFITGERPIEEVYDYLEEIRAMGGDELNEIYQRLYDTYMGK